MTQPDTLIIIPARYHSSRFPGKPLQLIKGKSMLERVYQTAQTAAHTLNSQYPEHGTQVIIATEDQRIIDHAGQFGAKTLMTSDQCRSGTDRAYAASAAQPVPPKWVINFQGDSPLTPPHVLCDVITALYQHPDWSVVTPVLPLSWPKLDALRQQKHTTPFSGTTAIIDDQQQALWFSKHIVPAIREEAKLRSDTAFSPVYLHVGLYGYQYSALERFVQLPAGHYEQLEGLEQLRLLEHHIPIHCIQLDPNKAHSLIGVDTLEDAQRAEAILDAESENL